MSTLQAMLSARPPLDGRIRQTEIRIAMRRAHLSATVANMEDAIRRQAVSAETLATAVLCGVALERSRYLWDWRLLPFLGAGRTGIRLLRRLTSRSAA